MALIIRLAQVDDAPAMAHMGIETFVSAHHGQIPEEVWIKRRDEWNEEVSARNWARTLRDIADGTSPRECVYIAIEEVSGEVVGIAMGQPAAKPAPANTGEINVLYVRESYQGRGLGRRLVQAVAGHVRQLGMPALEIAVLTANAPARGFYEALGGQIVREAVFEDYGYLHPEVVYRWADTQALVLAGDEAVEQKAGS
jgi:ribosomal protein S18 acetylase RimI-like enzyme